MRKYIWISFVVILFAGCGSRKKNVLEGSSTIKTENTNSGAENASLRNSTAGEMTFSDFLENRNLKIKSNGNPYQLNYGGMFLSGSADVEFSETKQERKTVYRFVTQTTYQSQTTYKSQTQYKTQTAYRNVNVERSGLSWGNIACLLIAAFIAGAIFWPLAKTFIPKWRINIF